MTKAATQRQQMKHATKASFACCLFLDDVTEYSCRVLYWHHPTYSLTDKPDLFFLNFTFEDSFCKLCTVVGISFRKNPRCGKIFGTQINSRDHERLPCSLRPFN